MELATSPVVTSGSGATLPDRVRRGLLGIAIGAAAAVAGSRFLYLSLHTLRFPYPLDYGEGAVLDGALRLARFMPLYPADLPSPPWFVSNYPPVSYLLHVPFVWAAGPALWYGRLLSQLSALCAAVLIGHVVARLTRQPAAGAVSALTFLAIPIIAVWSQYDRVDMLGCALAWAGLWLIVVPDRPRLTPAAICFLLASFTRQTAAVPALCAAYVWLRSEGHARIANRLAIAVTAGAVALFLVLDVSTGGGFFRHTVTGTVGRMDARQLLNLDLVLVDLIPWLLAIAAGVMLLGGLLRPDGWALAAAYIPAAVAVSLLAAKEGSYINYFLDLCAACSLAAGLCVGWLRRRTLSAVTLLAVLSLQAVMMGRSNALYDHLLARLARAREYGHLAALVRAEPGPILADEPLALLPLSGRTIDFQPFAMTQLARAGRWDATPFVDQLREQRYALLLARQPRRNPTLIAAMWDAAMADAIRSRYETVEEVPVDDAAVIAVMRPRRSAAATHIVRRLDEDEVGVALVPTVGDVFGLPRDEVGGGRDGRERPSRISRAEPSVDRITAIAEAGERVPHRQLLLDRGRHLDQNRRPVLADRRAAALNHFPLEAFRIDLDQRWREVMR